MKQKIFFLSGLVVAVCLAGCNKPETTSQKIDQLQAETKAAGQDLNDYTFAQKSAFTEKLKAQLAEINRELDQLSAKVETFSAAAKAEAQPKLQALRDKASQLGKQVDAAENATESTWDSVKTGSKKAYDELKDGFNQARHWVSEKIAP